MQHALMFGDFPEQSFREMAAVPLNSLEPRHLDSVGKSAGLRHNFYARAFSIATEETPIRENSASFAAILHLQTKDLHFTPQIEGRKFVLERPNRSNFCSRAKLTGKIQGRISTPDLPDCPEASETMCCRICRPFERTQTPQIAGTGNLDNREGFQVARKVPCDFPFFLPTAPRF
jgi:hypothetical protein